MHRHVGIGVSSFVTNNHGEKANIDRSAPAADMEVPPELPKECLKNFELSYLFKNESCTILG